MADTSDYHDSGLRPASSLSSWVSVAAGADFPIQNLPWGVGVLDGARHVLTRIGDSAISMAMLAQTAAFASEPELRAAFAQPTLNAFMGLGKPLWRRARAILQELLGSNATAEQKAMVQGCMRPVAEVTMCLPADIGDYTDYYASIEHATNAGIIMRGKDNALQPNWLHIPVAYHGRSSSVIPSGTPVVRPCGQQNTPNGPVTRPSQRLDFELEMGYFIGGPCNKLGERLDVKDAAERIFGVVVLNDWSARDVQAWEYVPLGPFLGKNFGTTISTWIVSEAALEPWLVPMAEPRIPFQPYLDGPEATRRMWDVKLECLIKTPNASAATPITHTSLRHLYWSPSQFLAHHTINGCPLRPGDLLGTGTISAPSQSALSYGSLMEKTWNGAKPFEVEGGERTWLQDGDEVVMRGWCEGEGYRVGFGECAGVVLPAVPL